MGQGDARERCLEESAAQAATMRTRRGPRCRLNFAPDAPIPIRGEGESMFGIEVFVALAAVVGAVAFMLAGRPSWDRFLPW